MSEDDWEFLFPMRKPVYTYDGFLRAVGKFDHFCGENNLDGYTDDQACARELAGLFAHFGQETGAHDRNQSVPEWRQALYWLTEINCSPGGAGAGTAVCDYKKHGWSNDIYKPVAGVQYYGRGPF